MSKKRKRREPNPDPDDGEPDVPASDPQVRVRCVVCHVTYNTSLKAFNNRGCTCPKCGGSKAQLIDVEIEKTEEPPPFEEKEE